MYNSVAVFPQKFVNLWLFFFPEIYNSVVVFLQSCIITLLFSCSAVQLCGCFLPDLQEPHTYMDMVVSPSNRCPMSAYTTRSRLECAINCSSGGSCTGFQFDTGSRRCTPYKFSTTCPTPLTAPVSMYVMLSTRC